MTDFGKPTLPKRSSWSPIEGDKVNVYRLLRKCGGFFGLPFDMFIYIEYYLLYFI